jgi:polyisoprenoid-binding protein YceI
MTRIGSRHALALTLALSACSPAPATSGAAAPSASAAPAPTVTPTAAGQMATTAPVPAGGERFVARPRSVATVRVAEHLAVNLVNTDAVLTTEGVSGTLTLRADGTFTPDSRIVVDMTTLHSDQALRDRWLQLFGIETNRFKESFFVPERAVDLPSPLPSSGAWSFTLEGTLTVHGVARPVIWKATAKRDGRDLTGTATTSVRWADFSLEKPQAAVFQVASVSDDIRLELAFIATQTD